MDFKTFLTEAGKTVQQTSEQRTHSEHVNHLPFDGHDGVAEAHKGLTELNNFVSGKKKQIPKSITTKIDGSPAFHLIKGQDGRVGIATKGLFNKDPKIAWNHEDVTKHYGHAPGLEAIMHDILDHGHKILPKDMRPGEIYKGDALFGGDRKPETRDGHVSFMPNLLRYKYPKGSNEADRAQRAKIGIALHTHYDAKGRASPITDEQRNKFQSHPDVFDMDPRIQVNPENYTPSERTEYNTHMENARREYQKLDSGAYDAMGHHNMDMRSYANDVVRKGNSEPLTTEGYISHLNAKHEKEIAKYKTQASVDKKMQAHSDKVNEIMRNKEHFDKIFKMHDHLQKAKDVLIGVLDKNNASHVELPNGEPTAHEGYVDKGGRKYVNQSVFSKNLLSGMGRIQQVRAPIKESLYESVKMPLNSQHVLLGRFQGVQMGHVHGVENAKAIADKEGSPFTLLTTHTHDKKNPLTPEQKMYYLHKAMPPGTNIESTSKESPSLMHYASKAYANGVRRLVVHAGSDRIDSYNKLLNSYKGVKGPHGFYGNNMQFEFRNMGERETPDTSTPEKKQMIDAALHGDRDTFHSLMGGKLTPEQKDENMRQTVLQNSSGTLMKQAAATGNKKLARTIASPYMEDKDLYKMMKDLNAGTAKFQKPKKPIKESLTTASAGEMVRGFGDVSGNPAVNDAEKEKYATNNTSSGLADDENNGYISKYLEKNQNKIAKQIGFKEFSFKDLKGKK